MEMDFDTNPKYTFVYSSHEGEQGICQMHFSRMVQRRADMGAFVDDK